MSQSKSFSLILLYDKVSSSLPVAQALKEKNIDVHIAQNAGELIQAIAAKNVDLVGLSVNHASTRSLIQVLREKTRVKILIFGEDKSPQTAERVDRSDADFKVNGVATAYNVWMKIAQAVKLKMKETESNGSILYSGGKSAPQKSDAAIVVKSSKDSKKESNAEIVTSTKKKKKFKSKSEKKESENHFRFENENKKQSEVMHFKKDAEPSKSSGKKSSVFKKSHSEKKKASESEDEILDSEINELEDMFKDPFKKKKSEHLGMSSEDEENNVTLGGAMMDETLGENNEVEIGQVWQTDKKADDGEIGSVVQMGRPDKPTDNKKSGFKLQKKEKSTAIEQPEAEELSFQKLVESAALCSYVSKQVSVESFGSINRITVVPVDKNKDRGFLVFCSNDNQFVTSGGGALDTFKKSLQDQLDHSEALGIGEFYNLEMEEIDVQSWISGTSDFHLIVEDPKSQRDILICFISKDAIYPDTNKSIETNMLKVELDVIPISTPLNFNIFLYFARNKRLIPYLRRGGKLTEAQMQRLDKHGVDTIYITEADRKALYSFFISQTLHQDLRPSKKSA